MAVDPLAGSVQKPKVDTSTVTAGTGGDKAGWGQAVFDNPKYSTANLTGGSVSFGRNKKCDICINHPVASGMHCTMTRGEDGVVFLTDSSTNGTWVNGKLVGKGKKAYVCHGDTIHLVRPSKIDPEEVSFGLYFTDPKSVTQTITIGGKYDIGKQLGIGSFAKVCVCFDNTTGEKYAVKIIDKKRIQMGSKKQQKEKEKGILEEVTILQKLIHPNIIKVYGAYETEDTVYIVLELVTGGDLLDKMIEMGEEFPEDRARTIFIQVYKAVEYLHSVGIVHRDLKPENILLANRKDDIIKLTDFGLSRIVGEGSFMQTICGTPMYVAPEVIDNMGKKQPKGYGKAVDVWSLGVILYMLLCGEPPFDQRKPTPILEQVTKGVYHMPEDLQQSLSPEAQDLVAQLLCLDPKTRITVEKIGKHPWIVGDRKLRRQSGTEDAPQDLSKLTALTTSTEVKSMPCKTPLAKPQTLAEKAQAAMDKPTKGGLFFPDHPPKKTDAHSQAKT